MNPAFTTSSEWGLVAVVNNGVVIFTLLVIVAALSFVAARAMIPSLVNDYQLPPRAMLLRPVLYVVALVALVVALFSLSQALVNAITLVTQLFPNWLI